MASWTPAGTSRRRSQEPFALRDRGGVCPRAVRVFLACLLFAACADSVAPELDAVEVSADDGGKADAATELSVRAGDTTLTVSKQLVRRGDTFVLRGRTSRTITDG